MEPVLVLHDFNSAGLMTITGYDVEEFLGIVSNRSTLVISRVHLEIQKPVFYET